MTVDRKVERADRPTARERVARESTVSRRSDLDQNEKYAEKGMQKAGYRRRRGDGVEKTRREAVGAGHEVKRDHHETTWTYEMPKKARIGVMVIMMGPPEQNNELSASVGRRPSPALNGARREMQCGADLVLVRRVDELKDARWEGLELACTWLSAVTATAPERMRLRKFDPRYEPTANVESRPSSQDGAAWSRVGFVFQLPGPNIWQRSRAVHSFVTHLVQEADSDLHMSLLVNDLDHNNVGLYDNFGSSRSPSVIITSIMSMPTLYNTIELQQQKIPAVPGHSNIMEILNSDPGRSREPPSIHAEDDQGNYEDHDAVARWINFIWDLPWFLVLLAFQRLTLEDWGFTPHFPHSYSVHSNERRDRPGDYVTYAEKKTCFLDMLGYAVQTVSRTNDE
ncbi:hypothetical protein BV25DRAFT_1840099 [Artomyces pyxidatus]|uniref:Uncharacterized protein n=1 Tax=Artomyces pyxidatus TaxID=48021 RepID=A0ACB8SVL1_9AGAM|nr:hypothetical protein BV25DRAFT_1840099 [Artomyces pyxidatus]